VQAMMRARQAMTRAWRDLSRIMHAPET